MAQLLSKEEIDREFEYLSLYISAIQNGCRTKFIEKDLGYGYLSLEIDNSEIRDYIKEHSNV